VQFLSLLELLRLECGRYARVQCALKSCTLRQKCIENRAHVIMDMTGYLN
jgi:hypothetical protein